MRDSEKYKMKGKSLFVTVYGTKENNRGADISFTHNMYCNKHLDKHRIENILEE